MSSSVLVPGTLFAGRYRVDKCIAEGGMGAVYEVLHAETGRRHALKIMHAHTLASAELRDRFRREARVAANIQSEFIVDVFDAGVDAATNLPFLVMELLQGEELGRLLASRGRFSAGETVLFLSQVAMALDKTHRAMIVHRDLKPENLFLTQRDDGSPRVKVLDFGVAKIVAETSTNAAATKSLGTPLYMAPEQFQPGNRVYPATDLFAMGMIAYTFLVGRSYWSEEANEAANVFSFALTAIRGPQESACARAARAGVPLPPAFDAWFARAVHVDPQARFPDATSMVKALEGALAAQPSPPMAVQPSYPMAAQPSPPMAAQPSYPMAAQPSYPMAAQPSPPMAVQPSYPSGTISMSGHAAAALTSSGPPTVVGTTGSLAADGKPASSGPGRALIAAAIGAVLVGALVTVFVLMPKSDTGSAPGTAASGAPTAVTNTASIPSVVPAPTPTEAPTAAPTEAPTASATAPTASATAPTAKPAGFKPKGPKPPGTSVYIRD